MWNTPPPISEDPKYGVGYIERVGRFFHGYGFQANVPFPPLTQANIYPAIMLGVCGLVYVGDESYRETSE